MRRILAVDDEPLCRALLLDTLRALGYEAVVVRSGEEALRVLESDRFDLVITDIDMPGIGGVELAERLAVRRIPVVLAGEQRPERPVPHRGFLTKPIDPDRAARILEAALAPQVDEWSGAEFLESAIGPIEEVPPARMVYLAHRVGATGALLVERGSLAASVGMRVGRVVHVQGIPGLLAGLGIRDTRDLAGAVAQAVSAGHSPERVLQSAVDALGAWLGGMVDMQGGTVRFDLRWSPPVGAFPFPDTVPRMLAKGLAAARSDAQVRRVWDALGQASVVARPPTDSPEDRWGLDSMALRVVRQAARPRTVERLIHSIAGEEPTRKFEVARALDTLRTLGVVVLVGAPLERAAEPEAEPTQEDTRARQMAEALVAMDKLHPIEILELANRTRLTEEDVANAYRDISRRYHPDTFFSAPPVIRTLAESGFARVSAAYEGLRLPGGLAEGRRFLLARARGELFVSERDHITARVSFRRGEVAFRAKDYAAADRLFLEAVRLDPYTWPHALNAALSGWMSKRLGPAEAIAALEAIRVSEPPHQAELTVQMGNVLKHEGRNAEALVRWRAALALDPENREAQRELRLHDLRNPAKSTTAGVFSGLLNRKKQ